MYDYSRQLARVHKKINWYRALHWALKNISQDEPKYFRILVFEDAAPLWGVTDCYRRKRINSLWRIVDTQRFRVPKTHTERSSDGTGF